MDKQAHPYTSEWQGTGVPKGPTELDNKHWFVLLKQPLQWTSEIPQSYEVIQQQQQQQNIKLWSGFLCSNGWRGHHWNKQGREKKKLKAASGGL